MIHLDGKVTWSLNKEVIEFISEHTNPNSVTAETGIGDSTIILSNLASAHYCFTPDEEEISRCEKLLNDKSNFFPMQGFSQNELPKFEKELDLALVDGGHGYPLPTLDAFYFGRLLKIGGYLLIDDIQIWTGKLVVDMLKYDASWRLVRVYDRTAVFQKMQEYEALEWNLQPKVRELSRKLIYFRRVRLALSLISRFRFRELSSRLFQLKARHSNTKKKIEKLNVK